MNRDIPYTNPLEFDFTQLANYIPPEATLSEQNKSWADRKSGFYTLYSSFINEGACDRRSPDELEFGRADVKLNAMQVDALRSWAFPYAELDPHEIGTIRDLGVEVFFRYRTIITARDVPGLAVVINNQLVFVFSR